MSRAHDKDVDQNAPQAAEPPANEPVGRVEVDARGRNVWRWARDVLDSTSVLLKRLDNKDLALEPTQKVPVVRNADAAPKGKAAKGGKMAEEPDASSTKSPQHPALQRERRRASGGGFDPYNSR